MTWLLVPVAVIVLLAVPFFAADSRDGADWKPVALRGRRAALVATGPSRSPQGHCLSERWRRELLPRIAPRNHLEQPIAQAAAQRSPER